MRACRRARNNKGGEATGTGKRDKEKGKERKEEIEKMLDSPL